MPETWPVSLSKKLKRDSFTKTPIDTRIFTPMTSGPSKVRQTDTKKRFRVQGTIWIDSAGHDTLENFIEVTLAGGTKTFNFPDGVTGLDGTYRFERDGLPSYSNPGSDEFLAEFTLVEV